MSSWWAMWSQRSRLYSAADVVWLLPDNLAALADGYRRTTQEGRSGAGADAATGAASAAAVRGATRCAIARAAAERRDAGTLANVPDRNGTRHAGRAAVAVSTGDRGISAAAARESRTGDRRAQPMPPTDSLPTELPPQPPAEMEPSPSEPEAAPQEKQPSLMPPDDPFGDDPPRANEPSEEMPSKRGVLEPKETIEASPRRTFSWHAPAKAASLASTASAVGLDVPKVTALSTPPPPPAELAAVGDWAPSEATAKSNPLRAATLRLREDRVVPTANWTAGAVTSAMPASPCAAIRCGVIDGIEAAAACARRLRHHALRLPTSRLGSYWQAFWLLVLYGLNHAATEFAVDRRDGGRVMVPRKADVPGLSKTVEAARHRAADLLEAAIGKEADMNPNEQQQQLRAHIRWMIRRDMAEVLEIEREGFEFPWCEDDFIRCLRQRNCIGMVAEHDERVVGFMIYELHKTRLHVLELRRGRGRSPPRHRHADDRRSWSASSRASAARGFCSKCAKPTWRRSSSSAASSFRAVSVLRDFYDDTPEDAYLMQYRYRPAESEIVVPINRITRLAG